MRQAELEVKLGGEPGGGALRLGRLGLSVVDLPALRTALTPGAGRTCVGPTRRQLVRGGLACRHARASGLGRAGALCGRCSSW